MNNAIKYNHHIICIFEMHIRDADSPCRGLHVLGSHTSQHQVHTRWPCEHAYERINLREPDISTKKNLEWFCSVANLDAICRDWNGMRRCVSRRMHVGLRAGYHRGQEKRQKILEAENKGYCEEFRTQPRKARFGQKGQKADSGLREKEDGVLQSLLHTARLRAIAS